MSRPANPAYPVRTWAINANHPAGAEVWSGQSVKVEPPGPDGGFVPNQGAAAEYVNKLFYDAFVQDQAAKDYFATVLDALAQGPTLNFPRQVTAVFNERVKFDPNTRYWLCCDKGTNDIFVRTRNPCATWPSSSEISAGLVHTLPIYDFAFDNAGRIVAWAQGFDRSWTYDGSVWTKRTSTIGQDNDQPALEYDALSGLFVYASLRSGGGATDWATSADAGATWTARTAPSGWPNTTLTLAASGSIVVAYAVSGTNMYTSRSTDGGVTWSNAVVTALGFTATTGLGRMPEPIWTGERFVLAVPGTGITAWYESADGASWSKMSEVSMDCTRYAALGDRLLLAAQHSSPYQLIFSRDGGASWQYGTQALVSYCIASSGAQFLISSSATDVWPGLAAGLGNGDVP